MSSSSSFCTEGLWSCFDSLCCIMLIRGFSCRKLLPKTVESPTSPPRVGKIYQRAADPPPGVWEGAQKWVHLSARNELAVGEATPWRGSPGIPPDSHDSNPAGNSASVSPQISDDNAEKLVMRLRIMDPDLKPDGEEIDGVVSFIRTFHQSFWHLENRWD